MDKIKAMASLARAYDASVLNLERADAVQTVLPLSSNLLAFDAMSGIGGLPEGKLIEISGAEGTYKTAFCLHMIARANELGHSCQFYNVEEATDWKRMNAFGINPDLTHTPTFYSAEDICRQIKIAVYFSVVADLYKVIVVDSIALMRPELLQDRGQMRLKMNENVELAKIMTQLTGDLKGGFKCPKMPTRVGNKVHEKKISGVDHERVLTVGESRCMVIFTNHLKTAPDVKYGDPTYTPGGKGKDWNYDFRLKFFKASADNPEKDEYGRPLEVKLKLKNSKSRVSVQGGVCELTYYPPLSKFVSSDLGGVVSTAVRLGVVEKKGAWYYCDDFPDGKLHGTKAVEEFLNGPGTDLRDRVIELDSVAAEEAEEAINEPESEKAAEAAEEATEAQEEAAPTPKPNPAPTPTGTISETVIRPMPKRGLP